MSTTETPLRYPGGKSQLAPFVTDLLRANNLLNGIYAEPFAGGAGLALKLLFAGHVSELWLNDIDPAIYGFWHSIVKQPAALCELIKNTPITVEQWYEQKTRIADPVGSELSRGFAALFLNRVNRSGIISGGLIGGKAQTGNYKMDCRFNRAGLIEKIRRIAEYSECISVTQHDAKACIPIWSKRLPKRSLINIDPPYFAKGHDLYMNFYTERNHADLAQVIRLLKCNWMLTYDDAPEIEALYRGFPLYRKGLKYSAQVKRQANEILVLAPGLISPASLVQEMMEAA